VITPARPVELRFLCNGGELSLYVSSKQVKKIGRIFSKFGENRWNRAGSNSKTDRFTVHCFKNSEKDKSQQKICKKTRSNSKVTNKEIFVKHNHLDW
jgi:hypothetical protein